VIRRSRPDGAIYRPGGSQVRKTPRGIAPRVFRLRPSTELRAPRACRGGSASARSRALASQPRRAICVRVSERHMRRSGPVGSGRPLSDVISAEIKTVPKRFRAAAAPIRPKRSSHFVAEPIDHWRTNHPSRRRHREDQPRRAVFPRREAGGPRRSARSGVSQSARTRAKMPRCRVLKQYIRRGGRVGSLSCPLTTVSSARHRNVNRDILCADT
jgi:hypothetical protein